MNIYNINEQQKIFSFGLTTMNTDLLFTVIKNNYFHKRERLSLSPFLWTEDIEVHIVHISCVIITYTLE